MTPRTIRKLFGVAALAIAAGMTAIFLLGGEPHLGGPVSGVVLFCGLGGMFLVCS